MCNLRPLQWPGDREALYALDMSFTTDRIYHVVATSLSFTLHDTPITPALHKDYHLADYVENMHAHDYVVIAEVDTVLVGMAALELEPWNRRAVLFHLCVAPTYRGRGIGRALIEHVVQVAQEQQARCLWLETQNVNYGAIQFYQQVGFQLCGLDTTLYDQSSGTNETALFFVRTF